MLIIFQIHKVIEQKKFGYLYKRQLSEDNQTCA